MISFRFLEHLDNLHLAVLGCSRQGRVSSVEGLVHVSSILDENLSDGRSAFDALESSWLSLMLD